LKISFFRLFASVLLALSFSAAAQPAAAPAAPPVYALLSLIGDKLDIVIAQPQTGTLVDRNRHEPLPIADAVFDNTAISSAGDAIRRSIPKAELAALNSRSPVLFDRQRTLFADKDAILQVPDAIMNAIRAQQATHFVLISKHREEARLQFYGNVDGSGRLEGLGFYLEGGTVVTDSSSGESGRGYIAPFAYFTVTLADAKTMKILGRKSVTASTTISSARALEDRASPWQALSAAEKVSIINRLIQREVGRVMRELMRGG